MKIRKFSEAQGLSHKQVNFVYQDHCGAVWAGTHDGLNRFDGQGFKRFTKEKYDFQSNIINNIYEDSDGWLWLVHSELRYGVSTFLSIDLFQTDSYQSQAFSDRFRGREPFQLSDLQSIQQMPNRKLLFCVKNGEYFLYEAEKGFKKLPFPSKFVPFAGLDDHLTCGAIGNEVELLDLEGNKHGNCTLDEGYSVCEMKKDASKRLWILAQKRLPPNSTAEFDIQLYLYSDHKVSKIPLPHSNTAIYEHHLLPVNTDSSLLIIRKGEIIKIDKNLKLAYQASEILGDRPYGSSACSIVDQGGVVWYGHPDGLWMIKIQLTNFRQHVKNLYTDPFPARGIAEYGPLLFINSDAKSGFWDARTEKWKTLAEANTKFAGNNCFPMYLNSSGELWTANDRLYQLDSFGHVVKEIKGINLPQGVDTRIWSFFQDHSSTWWMGVGRGYIYYYDKKQHEKPIAFEAYNEFNSLRNAEKWHFLEDQHGIWIAAQNGLYLLDKQKGLVARYNEQESGSRRLPASQFHYIYKDREGNLWLATGDAGLVKIGFDVKGKAKLLLHLSRADGLPTNELYAIFEDKFNHLWISSAKGLIRFVQETGEIRVYSETQGITNNEFNRLSCFQSSSGRLYFGGLNGVTSFDPKDFDQEYTYDPPMTFLEAALFSGKKDRLLNITAEVIRDQKISFHPQDKFITLQFLLQDYFDSDKITYSYQIEGMGTDWTELNGNTLQLSGLPYGTHQLHIRGKGPDNRISAHQLALEICVLRPFFMQGWFITLMLLLVGASGWTWYRNRIQTLKTQQLELEKLVDQRTEKIHKDKLVIEKQAEQLQELDELKSRFFANISHELRTPLTLILGPLQSVLKGNQLNNRDHTLLRMMQHNGEQLLKRINELLDLASLDAGKLKVNERAILLYPFLKRVLNSFESAANLRQIRLSLNFHLDIHLQLLLDVDKVEKILYNFLSNALKYTPQNGNISVTVERKSNLLEIGVADSGVGIPEHELEKVFDRFYQSEENKSSGGTGIGLALCKELAKYMNGQVWAESQIGEGSKFYLQLPFVEGFEQLSEESEMQQNPVNPVYAPQKDNKATILVAEDNPSLLEYIQIVLEDYEVITAANGQLALEKLSECLESGHPVELIISDIMMPVMDGFELLQSLKALDAYRHIPVIMLTAHQKAEVKLEALRIGVDDYLVKPFNESELLARVANLINNSRGRKDANPVDGVDSKAKTRTADQNILTAADARWLANVEKIVLSHIADTEFTLTQIADKMAMTPRRLQQKIKEITGLTPKGYQREIQLEYARRVLESGEIQSISEISYKVGFKDAHYFSTLFQNRYGKKPNDYM